MAFDRGSGILAHPTSFPGNHGIGDLGWGASAFLDWLAAAGQRFWQVMPLVPTGLGDSPYSSVSAFAGNPLLISLDSLAADGLLDESDLRTEFGFPSDRVEFEQVRGFKEHRLHWAFERFRARPSVALQSELDAFAQQEAGWLDDFALFMAAKDAHGGQSWLDWDPALKRREPEALRRWRRELGGNVEYHAFVQFVFRRQWNAVRAAARAKGIAVIGDIPIFVAHDSADVWANQAIFRLNADGLPAVVAGVPPDYFSATGQLWGNPLYDWPKIAATGYRWWISRFANALSTVDIVRIDHFRGFAAAWTVPADAVTAASGNWEPGPGRELFDAVLNALGSLPLIVEDLGLITEDVRELRRDLDLPGMAVLQFAFDGDAANVYLPHNFGRLLVVYPGTHDNQTTRGWFDALPAGARAQVQAYIGRDGSDIAWDFIRLAMASVADLAIVPLQDAMRLGDAARMNVPGTPNGNWSWRFRRESLDPGLAHGLAEIAALYGRAGVTGSESV